METSKGRSRSLAECMATYDQLLNETGAIESKQRDQIHVAQGQLDCRPASPVMETALPLEERGWDRFVTLVRAPRLALG